MDIKSYTFKNAADSYIEYGGENKYLKKIVNYFQDTLLTDIHPFDIYKMAESLYPDVSGATKNRCAITPTRAVILHAYERGWRDLIRLKRFKEEKPKLKLILSC